MPAIDPSSPVRAVWPHPTAQNPWGTPGPCRIAIVGEAPGDDEWWLKRPFVGHIGVELDAQLRAAGIDKSHCLLTNVLDTQPPDNNVMAFCIRKEALPGDYPVGLGPIITSPSDGYLRPDLLPNLDRLRAEIQRAQPNVVIALGATAAWACLGATDISRLRGYIHRGVGVALGYKTIATWHPGLVVRSWQQRAVAIGDLAKALTQSAFPDVIHDSAELWLQPTIADLADFEARYIRPGQLHSVDVETSGDDITCLGIAPDRERAIVIPFRTHPVRLGKPGAYYWRPSRNYWPTAFEELQAWSWVERILRRRDVNILGQNHLYDIQRLLFYGIAPLGFTEDTMLAAWSRFQEMRKSLDFLGSVHTNFPQWKKWGARHSTEDKRDD